MKRLLSLFLAVVLALSVFSGAALTVAAEGTQATAVPAAAQYVLNCFPAHFWPVCIAGFDHNIEIEGFSASDATRVVYTLYDAATNAAAGQSWERSGMNAQYYAVNINAPGSYYIVAVIDPGTPGEISVKSDPFEVLAGKYPLELTFDLHSYPATITLGQSIPLRVRAEGQGNIESLEYRIFKDGVLHETISNGSTYHNYYPKEVGKYTFEATLKNDQGKSYDQTCGSYVTVGDHLAMTAAYAGSYYANEKLVPLGDYINIYTDILGSGAGTLTYAIRNADTYEYVDTITTTEHSINYTPKAEGRYWCEVTLVNDRQMEFHKQTSTFTVVNNPVVRSLQTYSGSSSFSLGEPVTLIAAVDPQTAVKSLTFTVTWMEDGQEKKWEETVESLSCVFTPTIAADYTARVFVTDANGTVHPGDPVCYFLSSDLSANILRTDKGDYYLGDTVNLTLETVGSGEIESVYYSVYSVTDYEKPVFEAEGKELTFSFKPTFGGEYSCTAVLKDTAGNYSDARYSVKIQDLSLIIEEFSASTEYVEVGKPIILTAKVNDATQVESITCTEWFGGEETATFIQNGNTYTAEVIPTVDEYYRFGLTVVNKNGSIYREYLMVLPKEIESEAGLEDLPTVSLSSFYTKVGEPITFTAALKDSNVDYFKFHIDHGGIVEEYTVPASAPTYTYTPSKPGNYTVDIVLPGTTLPGNNIWTNSNQEFFVSDKLIVTKATQDRETLTLGETINFNLETVGTGKILYGKYTIRKPVNYSIAAGDSFLVQTIETTDTSFSYTPTTTGTFYLEGYCYNEDGVYFAIPWDATDPEGINYWSLEPFTVNPVPFISEFAASAEKVDLGESLIFTPKTLDDTKVKSVAYSVCKITAAGEEEVHTASATLEPFAWKAEAAGDYRVYVTVTETTGVVSTKFVEVRVAQATSNVEKPAEKPATGGADLSGAQAGTLDQEANAWSDEGADVQISMGLGYVKPEELPGQEMTSLVETVKEKIMELISIDLHKIVDGQRNDLHETRTVLTLAIPFDTLRKTNIQIYRIHEGLVQSFARLAAMPGTPQDGTFFVDYSNKQILMYSSKFSVYAVAYDNSATVTYMDGEEVVQTEEFAVGTGLEQLYLPTKEGYVFQGWLDAEGNTVTALSADVQTDMVLTASWKAETPPATEAPETPETPPATETPETPPATETPETPPATETPETPTEPEKPADKPVGDNPNTGDDTSLILWSMLLIVSLAGVTTLVLMKKRSYK